MRLCDSNRRAPDGWGARLRSSLQASYLPLGMSARERRARAGLQVHAALTQWLVRSTTLRLPSGQHRQLWPVHHGAFRSCASQRVFATSAGSSAPRACARAVKGVLLTALCVVHSCIVGGAQCRSAACQTDRDLPHSRVYGIGLAPARPGGLGICQAQGDLETSLCAAILELCRSLCALLRIA